MAVNRAPCGQYGGSLPSSENRLIRLPEVPLSDLGDHVGEAVVLTGWDNLLLLWDCLMCAVFASYGTRRPSFHSV